MSQSESPGRPPDVSDDEIVDTVRALIDATESPVVERRLIQDELGYSEPTTRKRLNSLVEAGRIGRYDASGAYVFWAADDKLSGREATTPNIISDIESIDPEDVPQEKAVEIALARLPGYQPDTVYRDVYEFGDSFVRAGFVGFAVGVMLLLTETQVSAFLSPSIQASIIFGGFIVVILGAALQVLSIVAKKISERD